MDADAFLVSTGNTIQLQGGPWTATINGKVTSSDFSGGGAWGIEFGTSTIQYSGKLSYCRGERRDHRQ